MSEFLNFLHLAASPVALAVAAAAVVVAYAVFTLVGFGSALIAGSALALAMPVARVIPLLAILDFGGSATRGWRARHDVAWAEFARLFPGMLLGQVLGVFVLAHLPPAPMAVALGVFVVWQGVRGLLAKTGGAARPAYPALALGVFVGHHVYLRISRDQLFRLLNGLLVASGLSLVVRFIG